MSALPQPSFSVPTYSSKSYSARSRQRKNSRQKIASSRLVKNVSPNQTNKVNVTSVQQLTIKKTLPVQLQILLFLQKSSFGLALVLIASSIAVYVSNVRIPQLWSQEYSNLETLQRQERELIAINETLKHEIAQKAQEKNSQLVSLSVDNAIFIPPASISPSDNQKQLQEKHLNLEISSGY
jgi:hypothetical protein